MHYDHYIVSFSGGKDSMACLLHLLELGIPKERIELWHNLVDGYEQDYFMDWPITEDYCRAVARHFGVPLYFSWKEGGFRGELMRNESPTAATCWQRPDGRTGRTGGQGPNGTRLKFPQVSADLKVRWCSAYLKIDVCAKAIANQERFNGKRTVLITGERGEEGGNRSRYAMEEPHRTNRTKRHVDHWRPVRDWPEREVWAIMERWKVRPHPAYQVGFSRVSCALCIFGNKDQWASARQLLPSQFTEVSECERNSGFTIQRKHSIVELADAGTPYPAIAQHKDLARLAARMEYDLPITMDTWQLPAGAYGHSCGPN